jgi:multiple sugar transport system permease protein
MISLRSDQFQEPLFRYLGRILLVSLFLACILPFWYMVMLAIHNNQDVVLHPLGILLPTGELSLKPFTTVLSSSASGGEGFLPFIRNSMIIAVVTVVLTLIVATPAAYALARYVFPGRRMILGAFLVVYLFPSILLAIPLFVFFTRAHLLGSLYPVAVVYVAQTLPVAVYMMREYLDSVPRSVEEAAFVDGCSRWQMIRRVTLPLSVPALGSVGVYVFMIAWNEYLFALLFLVASPGHWTVSLGLSQLSSDITVSPPVLMAGSVILTVPIVLLFFGVERFLRGGLVLGAEKG